MPVGRASSSSSSVLLFLSAAAVSTCAAAAAGDGQKRFGPRRRVLVGAKGQGGRGKEEGARDGGSCSGRGRFSGRCGGSCYDPWCVSLGASRGIPPQTVRVTVTAAVGHLSAWHGGVISHWQRVPCVSERPVCYVDLHHFFFFSVYLFTAVIRFDGKRLCARPPWGAPLRSKPLPAEPSIPPHRCFRPGLSWSKAKFFAAVTPPS